MYNGSVLSLTLIQNTLTLTIGMKNKKNEVFLRITRFGLIGYFFLYLSI